MLSTGRQPSERDLAIRKRIEETYKTLRVKEEEFSKLRGKKRDEALKNLLSLPVQYKVIAVAHEYTTRSVFGEERLTDNELLAIKRSVKTKTEVKWAVGFNNFSNALSQISQEPYIVRQRYQKDIAELKGYIYLYETQKQTAQKIADSVVIGDIKYTVNDKEVPLSPKEMAIEIPVKRDNGSVLGYMELYADGTSDFNIDVKGGLYEDMVKQAERAKLSLTILKAYVEVLSDIIYATNSPMWAFLSLDMEEILQYPDDFSGIDDPILQKYSRFNLNERRAEGETITPEEEKWALFPDYYELEARPKDIEGVNFNFDTLLDVWQLDRKALVALAKESIKESKKV